MTLQQGVRLGAYEIEAPIGAGGMGEVYRARDTELGREVAIKVLPEAVGSDPDRLARFRREAKALAALNHPQIATLFGFFAEGDVHFLVMELVGGEDLSERIKRGPMAADEAVAIFCQIAEGLEAAHEKGIIHRDLKPANIRVIDDGSGTLTGSSSARVKILDFGLAKALETELGEADLSQSPTLTANATRAGVLLGTAAYMSPEQAQGMPADKRSDIWAFGVCLYEALTGSRAFAGDNASLTLAAILKEEPELDRIEARFRRVLRRCLEKSPARRYRDIADVRLDLEAAGELDEAAEHVSVSSNRREKVAWAAAALAAVVAGWSLWTRAPEPLGQPLRPVTRLSISTPTLMPEEDRSVVISPDGRTVVFLGQVGGKRYLFRRDLDALEATPIPGTINSWGFQFFSYDGRWLVHMSGDAVLQKIPLEGGRPIDLIDALIWGGGDWGSDGTLVVGSSEDDRIHQLSAEGGELIPLTTHVDDELQHQHPRLLPGDRAIVFDVRTPAAGRGIASAVAVQRLGSSEHTVLMNGSLPRYFSSGHLVFQRGASLWAVEFDADTLTVLGEALPLIDEPFTPRGNAAFSSSESGSLVYTPRTAGIRGPLVWLDREGRETLVGLEPGSFIHPRVASNGRRIAFVSLDGAAGFGRRGRGDILILEENSLQPRQIPSDSLVSESPLWAPDSQTVVFRGFLQEGGESVWLYDQNEVREVGTPTNPDTVTPSSWTEDGHLLASFARPVTGSDILSVNVETGAISELLASNDTESDPDLSPDGRWLTYARTIGNGTPEVFVRPFPEIDSGGPWPIGKGRFPLWNADGTELFFVRDDALWSVRMGPEPPFVVSDPVLLIEGPYFEWPLYSRPYDYDPHTDRFLVVRHQTSRRSLVVVQDLGEELKRRFAAQ